MIENINKTASTNLMYMFPNEYTVYLYFKCRFVQSWILKLVNYQWAHIWVPLGLFLSPAQIVERAIHVLFKTQANINVLKYYLQREFRRVLEDRVPFSEFLLSRYFRGVYCGATR